LAEQLGTQADYTFLESHYSNRADGQQLTFYQSGSNWVDYDTDVTLKLAGKRTNYT